MKKVVIFGIGDFAELVHYYLSLDPEYQVVAFTVDKNFIENIEFKELPVVPFEEITKYYTPDEFIMFIALGYNKLNKIREEKFNQAKAIGYHLLSYIHSKATVFDNVEIGENCFIFEDNTIQPFSKIGNNTVLWSGNHLGHHSIIGNHCFITSHVVIAGRVSIGNNTFIGINSTIRDHISIGCENVIGAGSLVLQNTNDQAVVSPKATEVSKVPSYKLRGI